MRGREGRRTESPLFQADVAHFSGRFLRRSQARRSIRRRRNLAASMGGIRAERGVTWENAQCPIVAMAFERAREHLRAMRPFFPEIPDDVFAERRKCFLCRKSEFVRDVVQA